MVAWKETARLELLRSLPVMDRGACVRERFCADLRCSVVAFESVFFRCCLRRPARLLVWLCGPWVGRLFAADFELIRRVGQATCVADVQAAIDDHWTDPVNDRWVRRRLGARISTQRLRCIASQYVPAEEKPRFRFPLRRMA